MASHTPSQRYLSTRGGSYDLSFEEVILKGLASDGGLFIPEEIPALPSNWESEWSKLSFQQLAFEIFSLYISPSEIPSEDLKTIIEKSYGTFRASDITPVISFDAQKNINLLELFHGPTFAFKDVALQFLGNLFEYFLVRKNEGKKGRDRDHLTIIGATSGDTGSAAIYGLRGKKDVSVFIMHPQGKVSPIQEAQMTTVTDPNVHNLAVDGSFDDCQDYVKALFGDAVANEKLHLAAVNSINWGRILAQITYYFSAYFQLIRTGNLRKDDEIKFVVPTGNFGDILAGFFAKRMGLKSSKLVISTNSNDILHRYLETGHYVKQAPSEPDQANGNGEAFHAPESGVQETLSPAMDILVSSNFERLLWFLAHDQYGIGNPSSKRRIAGEHVRDWLTQLKEKDGFRVDATILKAARADFESERVSDEETVATIRSEHERLQKSGSFYVIDPHTAVGVAAARRSVERDPKAVHVALATAHPAKFSQAVEMALAGRGDFDFNTSVLPKEFQGLLDLERRVTQVRRSDSWAGVRKIILAEVEAELDELYAEK